jgi:phage/plasmid-like protein (TIGR03299 family)
MSHEITVREDGTQEFFAAGSTPVWHRLGQRTERAVTSGAALRMAGLDWKVEECPIHAEVDGGMRRIATHKSIVRRDTKAVLGVVGRKYRPVQNDEAFEWLDGLVGSRLAVYETAGSIRNGALVWALVRLPGELRIANTDDVVKPFILVCNSHDGSVAFRALNTSVRVVCSNTLTLAFRSAGTDSIAVKHTERIHDRLIDAQEVLGLAVTEHRRFEAHMNILAERKLRKREFESYLDKVLGPSSRQEWKDESGEVGYELSAARRQITANFDHDLQRLKGIEHSAWSAFNAVSQYVDWERPTRGSVGRDRDERRFASMMFQGGADLKRRAWSAALATAGVR